LEGETEELEGEREELVGEREESMRCRALGRAYRVEGTIIHE